MIVTKPIKISEKTYNKLKKMEIYRQTFDDVISQLIEEHEKHEEDNQYDKH